MSRRQLQSVQEYSEISGLVSFVTASDHATWLVSSVLHFSRPYIKFPGASRRRWDSCCNPLGHIAKVPFLGESLPLQVCMIMRKLVSSGATQKCDCCESGVCAAQLGRHGHRQAQALMRHQSRKERALASIKLRGSQRLSFSSNWKQVVSVLNHRSVLFLELSNLDASETTVSGPWSSLKFSVICLCDLIVDKGVAFRRLPEVELPGPMAMQELPVKGKSLEGEEEKLLSSYQIAVQIDWYRQKIF